jgi:hypothetical protein
LVCLILGLVFASGPWLIASLACSGLAAVVLWRQRARRGSESAARPAAAAQPPKQAASASGTAVAAKSGPRRPKPSPAPAGAEDVEVWVVDGRPDYHARDCTRIADGEAEPVPLSQARADGFAECQDCTPIPGSSTPVWVLDGRPDYHREDCSRLARGKAEQIRLGQALDDGFSACDQCQPEGAEAEEPAPAASDAAEAAEATEATEPADASDTDQVWVVDGRPRYHLEACMIIQGQESEPIPLAQATEDGFMPCSMCEPFVSRV